MKTEGEEEEGQRQEYVEENKMTIACAQSNNLISHRLNKTYIRGQNCFLLFPSFSFLSTFFYFKPMYEEEKPGKCK